MKAQTERTRAVELRKQLEHYAAIYTVGERSTAELKALAPLREALAFSARAANAFYANPDRGFQALTLPGLRTALLKTYAHGMSSGLIMRVLRRRGGA